MQAGKGELADTQEGQMFRNTDAAPTQCTDPLALCCLLVTEQVL